jgi:hypothetical protein
VYAARESLVSNQLRQGGVLLVHPAPSQHEIDSVMSARDPSGSGQEGSMIFHWIVSRDQANQHTVR